MLDLVYLALGFVIFALFGMAIYGVDRL